MKHEREKPCDVCDDPETLAIKILDLIAHFPATQTPSNKALAEVLACSRQQIKRARALIHHLAPHLKPGR